MKDTLINSVKKAFDILDILVFENIGNTGIGLFELSKKLGIKPNTLHGILKTMIALGYVQQDEASKYLAGPKCLMVGMVNRFAQNSPLLQKIEALMKELSEKIGEFVIFAILADGLRIPVLRIEHNHPIKIDISLLENENIYSKTTGRILTAYANEYNLKRILDRWGYPKKEWEDIEDQQAFDKVLSIIKQEGYSKDFVLSASVLSISVPILDKEKKLVGSLGSYAPLFRCDSKKQELILKELKRFAAMIEEIA